MSSLELLNYVQEVRKDKKNYINNMANSDNSVINTFKYMSRETSTKDPITFLISTIQ